jgi:type II restriction enzyme
MRLKSDFLQIFADEEKTASVTEEIISTTESIISKVPKEKKIAFEKSERDLFPEPSYEPQDDLYDGGTETIRSSLSGWRLDVFTVAGKIPASVFQLDQVYTFERHLQQLHPENLNVRAKIRQQLQELRDLGLIEFLGGGVYRKLWKDV